MQGLARLREQQLELQNSSRRWVCPACLRSRGCFFTCPALPFSHPLHLTYWAPLNFFPTPPHALSGGCREGFVGLSAADTIRQCLRLGLKDQAQKLAREFKVGCA